MIYVGTSEREHTVNVYHDLDEIGEDECWELLASVEVSRVGIAVGGRIDVLPVNHTVVDGHVAWLSAAGTKLGAAAAEQPIGLEADQIDETGKRGWSVLVHGTARIVTDGALEQQLYQAETTPWAAPDKRTIWIEVADPTISGRRVS